MVTSEPRRVYGWVFASCEAAGVVLPKRVWDWRVGFGFDVRVQSEERVWRSPEGGVCGSNIVCEVADDGWWSSVWDGNENRCVIGKLKNSFIGRWLVYDDLNDDEVVLEGGV